MAPARADRSVWDEVARRYQRSFGIRLVAVAAFGSRARGTAREDSDYDVLLVADGLPIDPFERAAAVRAPLSRLGTHGVHVVARTPAEFLEDVTPLHLDLALDAIVIVERDGFLTRALATVRQRIGEAGLIRTEKLFWRFTRPHVRDWAIRWDGVRV